MPVVTPTRLSLPQTLSRLAHALRSDTALVAVMAAVLGSAGLVFALGPLPVQALLACH